MVKALAGSALTLAALFGCLAIACSSNTDSTFGGEPPKPDAEDGPISNLVADAALSDAKEAGPASCAPAIPPAFAPTWSAPSKAAACTTGELKGYYDACLASPGTTEADGTCATWKTAHAACGACAEPADQSGPIQWHARRAFYTLNVAGCIAVQQGPAEAGSASCGEAYNAAVECARRSCESCFAVGGTFSQFLDCEKSVQGAGICKSYENAQGAACTGYKNAGSPALGCFTIGSETQEAHFTRVVGLLCGP
jgi:hypothetical protein